MGVLEAIRYWILRKRFGLEVLESVHLVDGCFYAAVTHVAGRQSPGGLVDGG